MGAGHQVLQRWASRSLCYDYKAMNSREKTPIGLNGAVTLSLMMAGSPRLWLAVLFSTTLESRAPSISFQERRPTRHSRCDHIPWEINIRHTHRFSSSSVHLFSSPAVSSL